MRFYIDEESPLCINISGTMREKIRSKANLRELPLENIKQLFEAAEELPLENRKQLFEASEAEVILLLLKGSFMQLKMQCLDNHGKTSKEDDGCCSLFKNLF